MKERIFNLTIDEFHPISMQRQIADQIAVLIREGTILPNEVLPSEARFAEHHGVSRSVVRQAYQTLKNKKLIKSDIRRGSFVVNNGEGNAGKEFLKINISAVLKEKINVISLFRDLIPDELIERELSGKIEQLFAEYRDNHRAVDPKESPKLLAK